MGLNRKAVMSKASQSVSHAAIGDTGDNDNPPNTSVNGTATANMEDGVATTPDMPQAWSDTSMVGDPEEYAKKMVLSVKERLRVCLGLRGPLHAQTPTDVANAGRNANLKKKKKRGTIGTALIVSGPMVSTKQTAVVSG